MELTGRSLFNTPAAIRWCGLHSDPHGGRPVPKTIAVCQPPGLTWSAQGLEDEAKETNPLASPGPADRPLPEVSSLGSIPRIIQRRPARIGSYLVLDVLGEGGMGVVYLAEQAEPIRRRVAIKVVKLGMDTKEVLARFDLERQALALMSHANVAQVYDAGVTEEGRPYFVMEHCPGIPVTEFCDRHRLSVQDRLRLFIQVCNGVHHAHTRGIIHRDLKPSNILVSTPDDKPVAKIIDFGVAKATSHVATERTLYTEIGRAVGTPAYMSPEQAESTAEEVDSRTDVYSLGVLLYELLVGELPLDWGSVNKASFNEIVRRIREEDPPAPSTRWSRLNIEGTTRNAAARRANPVAVANTLRGDLDWVVMRSIEKERNRRYPTAAHLAEELERYLREEPVQAGPPSALYRVQRFVRKNRGPVLAASAFIALLIAGIAVSLFLYGRAADHAKEAQVQSLAKEEALRLATENEARATEQARLAHERAEQVLSLSDQKRLADHRAEAAELWPADPAHTAALATWLTNAQQLLANLDRHRKTLIALRSQGTPQAEGSGTGGGGAWKFSDPSLQWWHDMLSDLVHGLEMLQSLPGEIESVKRRLDFARTVRKRTLEDHGEAWNRAIASIANREECPKYEGLRIAPQLGLVPSGRDPQSSLWEFVHVQTGEVPDRRRDGSLIVAPSMGLVFVLLPGGSFRMGAVKKNPETSAKTAMTDLNIDSFAEEREGPVHDVTLEPFFISKFEMTQAQWVQFAGVNPSTTQGDLSLPVETVSWKVCQDAMKKLGLRLPTEAQWEYAARAGTRAPWWTGMDPGSINGAANLDDESFFHAREDKPQHEPWDDGYYRAAPVGKFRANPFGLHDVLGNVAEWCEDVFGSYELSVEPGSGLRRVSGKGTQLRVLRGGEFSRLAKDARTSRRTYAVPDYVYDAIGLRPARSLEGAVSR